MWHNWLLLVYMHAPSASNTLNHLGEAVRDVLCCGQEPGLRIAIRVVPHISRTMLQIATGRQLQAHTQTGTHILSLSTRMVNNKQDLVLTAIVLAAIVLAKSTMSLDPRRLRLMNCLSCSPHEPLSAQALCRSL